MEENGAHEHKNDDDDGFLILLLIVFSAGFFFVVEIEARRTLIVSVRVFLQYAIAIDRDFTNGTRAFRLFCLLRAQLALLARGLWVPRTQIARILDFQI